MSIAIPSLYSTSHAMQTTPGGGGGGQMSATALLQKAAQMGSSTSNASASSSLLKSFGKSPDHHSFGGFGGNNNGNHLHELVSSIAAAGGSSTSMFGGAYGGGDHEQAEMGDYRGFHGSNNQQRFSSLEQAGRLTRDFLGVGEIVRSVRDQQSGMDHITSLDSQGKTASHSHSQAFGGGNFQ